MRDLGRPAAAAADSRVNNTDDTLGQTQPMAWQEDHAGAAVSPMEQLEGAH